MAITKSYHHRLLASSLNGWLIFMFIYYAQLLVPWSVRTSSSLAYLVLGLLALFGFFGPAVMGVMALIQWSEYTRRASLWTVLLFGLAATLMWFGIGLTSFELVNGAPWSEFWSIWRAVYTWPILLMSLMMTVLVMWLSRWLLTSTRRAGRRI